MTALALSFLLLGGVVAPAFGAQSTDADVQANLDATSETVRSTDADDHPATLPDASVETVTGGDAATVPENATTERVTLVTGHTVTVVETDGETRYRVADDAEMRKVTTGNATYVFPAGVDFERFDRDLFDVDFLVRQNLTDAETDSIPLIVSESDRDYVVAGGDRTTGGVLDSVDAVTRTATLESIDAEAGRLDKDDAATAYEDLAADDAVDEVTLDAKHRLDLDETNEATSASTARRQYGVSGNDVKIAVLDSGIDQSHPAIDVVDERDFTDDTPNTAPDEVGHGTHVAGIVASDDETYTGIAPNASLVDVRVLGDEGWGYTSWIIDGIEYADQQDADVISMSIGGSVNAERSSDRYTDAVNAAVANGTLVVTSAGNDGYYGYRTVNTPGIQSKALTVGATNASTGEIAAFSSRGPTPYGYYLKPDLVAPGVGVTSAAAGTDGFVSMSGTSMSTPAVSGVAALLLEQRNDLSPEQVKSVLTSTADPIDGPDAYAQGAGEVNATAALGADAVVEPGTVDFGTYATNTTANRTVAVSVPSTAESSVTLNVTGATATNILTGDTVRASVNRSSVTIAAGNTERIDLGVDTSVPHGVYSGRVSFDGGKYTAVFGFVRAHEVTVEKQALSGTATDGDFVWLFAEDGGQFKTLGREGIDQLTGSTVTYHVVGGGEYNVVSHGTNEANGQPVVFSTEVAVDDDTSVVLDESATTEYQVNASEAESEHGDLSTRSVQVTYLEDTSYSGYVASLTAPSPDTATVRFGTDGEFDAAVEHLLVPSSAVDGEDNFSAEAVYHLSHRLGETSGTTFHVDQSALTEKHVTYYRNDRGGSYNATLTAISDFPRDETFESLIRDGIGDRRHQTVYLNDGVVTHGVGASSEAGVTPSWNLSTQYALNPDTRDTLFESVNRHPYTGQASWYFTDGNLSFLYAVPQVGQGPHVYADGSDDTATLRIGGETESETTTAKGYIQDASDYPVASGETVELTVVGNNDATSLSTRTETAYRTEYEPGGDNAPPNVFGADVARLTTNNTAGGTLTVRFTTSGDVESLSASVANDATATPFDGGTAWTAMSVEKTWDSDYTDVYEATVDVNEQFGQHAGTLDLAVTATDGANNVVETSTFDAVRVDAKDPTVSVTEAGAGETPATVDETIYTNGTATVNLTADGTPGDAEYAGTGLSADFTNFRTWDGATRTDAGDWTSEWNLSDLPDDGNYTVEAFAVDRFRNAKTVDTGVTVVLDRDAPDLGARVERAGNDGKVTLTSDEPLGSEPAATVEKPAGNDQQLTLTRNTTADGYVWEETFSLEGDGNYTVNASGADLTGNVGETTSTAEIETVQTTDKEVTVVLEQSGLFIQFRTDKDVESTVTVTESRSALAPLSRNLAGLNFLNGELGTELTDNLDNATIGVPVDESNLPPGLDSEQVTVSYYNESTGDWEHLDTAVENRTVAGEEREYWVTNVTHFSTYGAVAEDQQAPTVEAKSPDGTTLDWGTSQQTVRFDYGDDISGVNASAVELHFDGGSVTDDDATNITGDYATYNATGLDGGDHTAEVVVVDEAGNAVTETATFAVETDSAPPAVTAADPADGTELASGTESVDVTVDFADDASGVATDATRVEFDGRDVTDETARFYDEESASGRIVYTADSLSDGSTHALSVYLEDEAGYGEWHTVEFSVGSGDGGGGGGGGGDVPPPAVQVDVTALSETHAEARVASARAGAPGRISLDGGLVGGDATFRSVSVTPESEGPEPRFFVDLRAAGAAPDGVAAFDGTSETLGYLTATPTYIADDELREVGVAFDVAAATTDDPSNVALYRYDGGDWTRLDTEVVDDGGDAYRFRASADGTGTFAVGVDEPAFAVRDASLDPAEVAPGDEVTVSATVENAGSGTGTHAVELVVDGEVVATEEVTLAPGERTTVEFARTFETPGEYDVAVGSATAGALAVTADGTDDPSADGGSGERSEGGDGGVPGFGVPATLAALLAAALLARRTRT